MTPMTVDELAGIIAKSFDGMHERQGKFEQHVEEKFQQIDKRFDAIDVKLDQIEFSVSSQDRRISILEDRVRLLGTKAGLDFHQKI